MLKTQSSTPTRHSPFGRALAALAVLTALAALCLSPQAAVAQRTHLDPRMPIRFPTGFPTEMPVEDSPEESEGGWVKPYECVGKTTLILTNPQGVSTTHTFDWAVNGAYTPEFGASPGCTSKEFASGTVTVKWTWRGGGTPPAVVYVRETAHASADGWGDARGDIAPSVDDGGIGKEVGPTRTVSDGGGAAPDSQVVEDSISGSKWEREDSSGGVVSVSAKLSLSVTLTMPADSVMYQPTLAYLYAFPSLGFDAEMGGHTIITSPIETSYLKTNNPETFGRDRHDRNLDGSIVVDSGVTYDHPLGWTVTNLPLSATTPFDPLESGYEWTGGGGGAFLAPYSTGGPTVSLGLIQSSVYAFPTQTNISVKVTNRGEGGGEDSNTYAITWHAPYEGNERVSSQKTKKLMEKVLSEIEPDATAGTLPVPAGTLDLGGAIDTIAVGLKMYNPEARVAVGLAELVGKIAGMNKWKYEYAPQQTVIITNNPEIWNHAVRDQHEPYVCVGHPNIPSVLTEDSDNYQFCNVSVWRVELDNDETWNADGYNINGFDGNTRHLISAHKVDNVHLEYFYRYANDGTGRDPGKGTDEGDVTGGGEIHPPVRGVGGGRP